jgi:hypothetical protein
MLPIVLLAAVLASRPMTANTALCQIVSEEVTFVAGGRTIPGTLVHPESGRAPGILLLAGSGPTDRDWNTPLLPGKNGSARLQNVSATYPAATSTVGRIRHRESRWSGAKRTSQRNALRA